MLRLRALRHTGPLGGCGAPCRVGQPPGHWRSRQGADMRPWAWPSFAFVARGRSEHLRGHSGPLRSAWLAARRPGRLPAAARPGRLPAVAVGRLPRRQPAAGSRLRGSGKVFWRRGAFWGGGFDAFRCMQRLLRVMAACRAARAVASGGAGTPATPPASRIATGILQGSRGRPNPPQR